MVPSDLPIMNIVLIVMIRFHLINAARTLNVLGAIRMSERPTKEPEFFLMDDDIGYRSTLIPHQLNSEQDVLASFIDVVSEYCEAIKGPKGLQYDSIMRYYGISGDPLNLRQVGILHSVTRERVRQIQSIHLYKIGLLLRGYVISGLKCDCVLMEDLYNLRDRFFSFKVLTDSIIEKILLEEKITLTEKRKHHISLFFNALGIESLFFLGMTLYFTRKEKINLKKLRKAYKKMRSYLMENFSRPISLKTMEKDLKFPTEMLKIVASLNSSVEEIGTDEYQIKDPDVPGFDVAYRVLLKKESMNMTDLMNTVNGLRGKKIEKMLLSMDKRFKCIGKTNRWTLAETDINSDCYYQLVEKTLNFYNRPCTFKEIFTHIQKVLRSDIKFSHVSGAVHVQYGKKFYVLNDNRVILENWKLKYKKELKKPRKKDEETFTSALIRILSGRAMYCSQLITEIQKYKNISRSTCIQSLYASTILNKKKVGIKNIYSLKPDYKEILNVLKRSDPRKIVAEFIFDLFEREGKLKLNRRYIVEQVLLNLQVSKPFIYKYFRDSTDVFDIDLKSQKVSLVSIKKL